MKKEMLKAAPTLSKLLGVTPDMVRAHIKYGVGDIGRYCFLLDKSKTGKSVTQYYVMRSDIPKILHRPLTENDERILDGRC